MKLTTASKITIARVALIPVVLLLMYIDFPGHMYWALAVFIIASCSPATTTKSPTSASL